MEEKKEGVYRIDKHKDQIVHYNPDALKSFENRNKQLVELFEVCGHKIGGIKTAGFIFR